MTTPRAVRAICDAVRREMLASGPLGDAPRTHLGECGPCRLFAARLAIVDDGLEADAALAANAPLSAALRARIFGATSRSLRPVEPTLRRPRWGDLAVRAGAVAAVLVGAIAVLPESALAADVSIRGMFTIGDALSEPFDAPLLPRTLSFGARQAGGADRDVADNPADNPAGNVTGNVIAPVGLDADATTIAALALGALGLFAAGLALRRRP